MQTEDTVYIDEELTREDVEGLSIQALLDYLALDVIRINIERQVTGEIETSKDLFEDAFERYKFFRTNKTDPSEIKELDDEFMNFCVSIIDTISDRFGLSVDPPTEDSLAYVDVADNLYTFFILNREEFTTQFLTKYIKVHGSEIASVLDLGNNTDLSSQAYKRSGFDKESVTIIANINEIIDFVITEDDLDPLEFFDTINDNMECVNQMQEYYEAYQVTGQFVREYVDILGDHGTEQSLRIRNNVRVMFIMSSTVTKLTSQAVWK